VVWWATEKDAARSPLARILLGREDGVAEIPDAVPGTRPGSAEIEGAAGELWFATDGAVAAEPVRPVLLPPRPASAAVPDLAVARFDRSLDERWTRTSYTALTRHAHDAAVAGLPPASSPEKVEVDERAKTDEVAPEPVAAVRAPLAGDDPLAGPLLLGGLPGGARFGTLVHEVLERVDFAADDVESQLSVAARDRGAERLVPGQVDALVAGLVAVLDTPLGPLFDGRRLRDLGRGDRLDELAFDLPLAGGDRPAGDTTVAMAAIADVFEQHLPIDDPVATYHERLRDPLLEASVRGYLNGSIDLVARIGDRHVVVDYKSNALAPRGVELTSWHYRPAALGPAMRDADYPLQAALYAVALHRYLRWRRPGYDPEVHLGGVGYLFVRGMTGADTPLVDGHPCGVFAWHPPAAFVTALSDLLDTGAAGAG
jgi:exodeoxyribonuclease V beta subunit